MPVIISAKKDKFRRCGIAHPEQATTYPDDRFSKKELEILQKEPMLLVQIVPDDGVIARTPAPEKMKLDELKELCKKLKIDYPDDATRAVLIELVKKNTAAPPEG
ncbi:MAG: HI1506-related protein [Thermodesulfobacteriota bacterium]